MIGESSGVSTFVNNERIIRDNPVQGGRKQNTFEENAEQNFADVTSFSPQALALARNVAPPGEAAELENTEPQGRGQGETPTLPAKSLDIRV